MRVTGRHASVISTRPDIASVTEDVRGQVTIRGLREGKARIQAQDSDGATLGELAITVKRERTIRVITYLFSDSRQSTSRTAQDARTEIEQANAILTPQANVRILHAGQIHQLSAYTVFGSTHPTQPGYVEQVDLGRYITMDEIRPIIEETIGEVDDTIFAHVFFVREFEKFEPTGRRRDLHSGLSFSVDATGLCQLGNACARTHGVVVEDRCQRVTLAHELGHCLTRFSGPMYDSTGHCASTRNLMHHAASRDRITRGEADLMNPSGA